ncbi:hypothetical protein ACSSV1_005865 [Labrenzia sp. MBR-25]|jgi:hypothetical protein
MYLYCAYDPGLLVYLEHIEDDLPDHEADGFSLALCCILAVAWPLVMTMILQ